MRFRCCGMAAFAYCPVVGLVYYCFAVVVSCLISLGSAVTFVPVCIVTVAPAFTVAMRCYVLRVTFVTVVILVCYYIRASCYVCSVTGITEVIAVACLVGASTSFGSVTFGTCMNVLVFSCGSPCAVCVLCYVFLATDIARVIIIACYIRAFCQL